MIILCEGVDRIGKSTVCEHLRRSHFFSIVHFGRPIGATPRDQALFQMGAFHAAFEFFRAIDLADQRLCCDRSHLGEMVYGKMYRGSSGVDLSYIGELEERSSGVSLVLLRTRDFGALRARDDGLSFDPSRMEEEQALFESALAESKIRAKAAVDVTGLSIDDVCAAVERAVGLPNRKRWELIGRVNDDGDEW